MASPTGVRVRRPHREHAITTESGTTSLDASSGTPPGPNPLKTHRRPSSLPEASVRLRRLGRPGRVEHGQAPLRCLGHPHRVRHGSVPHRQSGSFQPFHDLPAEPGSGIEHGDDDAGQLEMGIGVEPVVVDRRPQLVDATLAQRLRSHRHEHPVSGRETVDREDPQRRRAVEEHLVVALGETTQCPGEHVLAPGPGVEVYFRPRQIDRRRDEVDPVGLVEEVLCGDPPHQHVVEAGIQDRPAPCPCSTRATPADRGRRRAPTGSPRPERPPRHGPSSTSPPRPSGWPRQ